ncbi:AAA family ATPase [Kineococcus endophyticus]|uniref:AAA family ATPase n=1 Tax=Kineococcus endophyticus TaxID=1181883 RepID=A0ABV3PB37_9ACTN
MGRVNVLVEGVSGAGKTSVATELERRGEHVVHGDRALAHQGDPVTGEPTTGAPRHTHHLWRHDAVRDLAGDRTAARTFFCGGSRNWAWFLDLFDLVVVLEVDEETLRCRLAGRAGTDEFGATAEERDLVLRVHRTREDVPPGTPLDATRPVEVVVDDLLRRTADLGGPASS